MNKFMSFVESLRTEDNSTSVDAILEGYSLLFETAEWDGTIHKMNTFVSTDENEDGIPWSKLDKWKKFYGTNPQDNKKLLDYWQSLPSIYDDKHKKYPKLNGSY